MAEAKARASWGLRGEESSRERVSVGGRCSSSRAWIPARTLHWCCELGAGLFTLPSLSVPIYEMRSTVLPSPAVVRSK